MKIPIPFSYKFDVRIASFLLILGATIIYACNFGPPENSRATQARKGYEHFVEHCAVCHGEDAKGVVMDTMAVQPPDLTLINKRRRQNEFPVMTIAKIIDGRTRVKSHGDRDMPIWGDVFSKQQAMTEDEIRGKLGEIIAYLHNIQN
ncbi:MAG: cytochrome c [Bacteroidia bacterium]|nr:cytochrome c [Bacteroidia bacterium]